MNAVAIETELDVEDLRRREYSRLAEQNQVYLDYTGACLYPESLVRRHLDRLTEGVFGNPHSSNPTSATSTMQVEEARTAVLRYFNASASEYEAIFTLNASGALKLVGESYPFDQASTYLLTYDNHNSVNGIREFARARGADVHYAPITDPDLRIDEAALSELLAAPGGDAPGLFAFPAQSNFSGVQHSLSWVKRAQSQGWDVLLDAAAFVPTNRLDLTSVKPDFVSVSFYKMFGYPTGVGCLLCRKRAARKLMRPWFAGGTVLIASTHVNACESSSGYALDQGAAAFEDGTVNYLGISAIAMGLQYLNDLGLEQIHNNVMRLTARLLERLSSLHHSNGCDLVHIYGPTSIVGRGGTVAMNLFDDRGELIHPREVERLASEECISIRTGCHCNPGAGQTALHISDHRIESVFKARKRLSLERFRLVADELREGAVRVSLGIASNQSDIDAFIELAAGFLDQSQARSAETRSAAIEQDQPDGAGQQHTSNKS